MKGMKIMKNEEKTSCPSCSSWLILFWFWLVQVMGLEIGD
jgi:hypothetical protein